MKFFHAADFHVGVENYGKIDQKTGIHTRLLDFVRAIELMVDQAIEQKIDFFLFCGDAYKTAHPTPTQQKLLVQQMLRLHVAGIPVVIVVGNHDHPLSFGKVHALDVFSYLPVDGFYVFSKPELREIETKSGVVQIVGIPWPVRNFVVSMQAHRFKDHAELTQYISERVGDVLQALSERVDPSKPAVLAGHLTVASGVFSGSEKCAIYGTDPLFLPSQLAIPVFDYVALGHLHKHQNLNSNGRPAVVYAGSIERVDFGERREQKGFCSVTISSDGDGSKQTSYEFVSLSTRPMVQIEVKLDASKDYTAQIVESIAQQSIADALVKVVYHLPPGKQDSVDLNIVTQACSNAAHLVGIFPVHTNAPKERRAALKVDMDFTTTLSRYFESKENLQARKDLLLEKAFMLQQELDSAGQNSE